MLVTQIFAVLIIGLRSKAANLRDSTGIWTTKLLLLVHAFAIFFINSSQNIAVVLKSAFWLEYIALVA